MQRTIFSGIQPTGSLTLGSYLGALRRFVDVQHEADCVFAVVDLHAMTMPHEPDRLRQTTIETATLFLAAGLDPDACVLIRQSDVPAHTELAYLLECTAHMGELSRMIQFKEKGRDRPGTRVSLFTYPALMAADILVYGATEVPVGDDQSQHVELTRDLAIRFNRTYGEVLVVPKLAPAPVAARVMDLQDPTRKMSKSQAGTELGTLRLLDPPDVVRRKVMRAVTDTETEVRYDTEAKPGVSNLLDILGGCTGETDLEKLATRYTSYGALKNDVVDAVNKLLEPLRARYDELAADPSHVEATLRIGAERARDRSAPILRNAKRAMGLS
jgi:tryptophanyl-tRNA synthetase